MSYSAFWIGNIAMSLTKASFLILVLDVYSNKSPSTLLYDFNPSWLASTAFNLTANCFGILTRELITGNAMDLSYCLKSILIIQSGIFVIADNVE